MTGRQYPFVLAVTGLKGLEFTSALIERGYVPTQLCSYPQKGESSDAFSALALLASRNGIAFQETHRPEVDPSLRLFFVGWQYLYRGDTTNVVVFHDSLLPRHRGFAPTVSALIAGDDEIGVTAFRPDGGVDTGPIVRQASFAVQHPMKIHDALRRQARLMVEIAAEIVDRDRVGNPIAPQPQSETGATYSLWRDEDDYLIDFNRPSDEIVRFIHALGPPYGGAKSFFQDRQVRIFGAEIVSDLPFVERHVGKIWRIDGTAPVVVCGSGLVRLNDIRDMSGDAVSVDKLRARFASR